MPAGLTPQILSDIGQCLQGVRDDGAGGGSGSCARLCGCHRVMPRGAGLHLLLNLRRKADVIAGLMAIPARPSPRYWSVDILRGVCALTVFLNHWVLWSNFAPVGRVESWLHRWSGFAYELFSALTWPTGGQHPALVGFFVLSGFCIHVPFEHQMGQPGFRPGWGDYLVRRAKRILPVYWTCVLLGLAVVAVEHWRPSGNGLLILHTSATPAQMAARIGCYSGLWPEEIFAGNYILGTVGVEILIYLAYPLFFRGAAAIALVAVGLQLLTLVLAPYVDPFVLFSSVLVMALFWYLGALAAHLAVQRLWVVRGWWLGAGWALFLALKLMPSFYGRNMLKQAAWAVVCMLVLGWALEWEKRHADWKERLLSRALRGVGGISYSLYAVHTPVILLVNWTMLVVGSHSYAWQLALNLGLSLAATWVVYQGIERRFYRARAA